ALRNRVRRGGIHGKAADGRLGRCATRSHAACRRRAAVLRGIRTSVHRRGLAGASAGLMRSVWRGFATYVAAVAGIFAASGVAIVTLKAIFPDTPDQALLQSLPALIAGSLASSLALIFTLLAIVQPATPAALRLAPGWETGRALGVMVLGMLTLGQALDSLTWLAGLGERGTMVVVRRVLEGAVGPDLFGAVVVFGVIAGASEELFFRGYMQTRLAEAWGAARGVVVTAACFGVLHVDVSGVHMALAFAMGVYLGFVVERTGSVLPAMVCHVVNNIAYTLQTAFGGTVRDRATNAVVAAACVLAFALCLTGRRRAAPPVVRWCAWGLVGARRSPTAALLSSTDHHGSHRRPSMPELPRRYVVMPLPTAAPFDPADRDGVFVL